MDISAAAAVSWSRGTTRGIDESSDGRCSAASAIISAVTTYSSQTAGCACKAFSRRSAAQQPRPPSHTTNSRRRSNRSASTPPYSPKMISGTSSTAPSRPTANADPVSCLAWTSRATSVASVPRMVTVRLAKSRRKSREVRSGVRSARSLGRLTAARSLGPPRRRAPVQARRRRYGIAPRPATRFKVLAPDFLGDLDDQLELGHFLLVPQHVALDRRGEAALRRQAELVKRHELGRLLDPPLERVRVLQFAALGGDQAEHDHLARRHEAQRLEATGALVVPL